MKVIREKGRLVAWLIVMVACSTLAGPAGGAERKAIIKPGDGGLDVTMVVGSEEMTYYDQERGFYVADNILLMLDPDEQYSVQEIEKAGRVYTNIKMEGSCFTFERLDSEPALTLEVAAGPEVTELRLTMASDTCGGCVTVWNRTNLNGSEEPWLGCPDVLWGAVCTYCISGSCPEPEPEPDPDPAPDPDWDCMWGIADQPKCIVNIQIW